MEEYPNITVESYVISEDPPRIKLKSADKSTDYTLDEDLDLKDVRLVTCVIIQAVCKHHPNQMELLILINELFFKCASNNKKRMIWSESIAQSDFCSYSEQLIENYSTARNDSGNELYTWQKMISLYTCCHNVTDLSTFFCKQVFQTKILRILLQNIDTWSQSRQSVNEDILDEANSAIGILHNVIRDLDPFQKELFATKHNRNILSKFCLLKWPYQTSIVAGLFTMANFVSVSFSWSTYLPVIESVIDRIKSSWESNLKTSSDGFHLDELICGMFYLLRSEEIKLFFLRDPSNADFLFEMAELMENFTEVYGSLTIFKLLSDSKKAKHKLIKSHNVLPRLQSLSPIILPQLEELLVDVINSYAK